MNFKYSIMTLLLVCAFSLNIMACSTNNKTAQESKNNTQQAQEKGTEQMDEKTKNLSQRAEKIATAVASIPGIKTANVVISEERALVGVNIENNAEGKITDDLKNKVDTKVKETDTEIKTVAVSADPDVITRITNVGNGIKEGRPLSEFGNEIEEIFRRIIPS
ncbi:YhcN/YlaJ family sporulation lipoprotein [Clostridium rectalis]|uniref:YhcN/YlaJ family sporulation lipoprotein n=1 Tax=Clostridium rectalis TaxID=2040295 RepID=UPI001FAAB242|nr:YhcN/YlaJ family sporulation lipoprotein [Clostridium rectalis]